MPTYTYTGRNTAGKRVRASIEAASPDLARNSLRDAGYVVYEVHSQGFFERDLHIPLFGRPRPKDMSIFCRELASILRAGVPVASALEMMEQQTENRQLGHAVMEMQGSVAKGEALSAAMARQGKLFPGMLVSMVAAGEESGNLEEVFTQMESYYEKVTKTRNSVGRTMIYPAILLVVMVVVCIVLMTKIVPMFTETYEDTGTELPALTRGVVAVSGWFGRHWWMLALLFAALAAGGAAFSRTLRGRHFFGMLARKTPVVGKLVVRSACASSSRMLSMLLASGLPFLECIELTAANMSNVYFMEALLKARDLVAEGWPLYVALRDTGMFPPLVVNMVSIGETSGDLQGSLEKLADFYDQEVSDQTARLLALLEPMMILFMAVFVITLVLAIYLPMLGMVHAYDQYL